MYRAAEVCEHVSAFAAAKSALSAEQRHELDVGVEPRRVRAQHDVDHRGKKIVRSAVAFALRGRLKHLENVPGGVYHATQFLPVDKRRPKCYWEVPRVSPGSKTLDPSQADPTELSRTRPHPGRHNPTRSALNRLQIR